MKTKTKYIWEALSEGEAITNITAFQKWNCTRLGGIIFSLRKNHDAPIDTRIRVADDGTNYAVYTIGLDFDDENFYKEVKRVNESIR